MWGKKKTTSVKTLEQKVASLGHQVLKPFSILPYHQKCKHPEFPKHSRTVTGPMCFWSEEIQSDHLIPKVKYGSIFVHILQSRKLHWSSSDVLVSHPSVVLGAAPPQVKRRTDFSKGLDRLA